MRNAQRIVMFGTLLGLFLFCSIYCFFGLRYLFVGNKVSLYIYTVIYWALTIIACYAFYRLFVVLESGSIFRNKTANVYLGIALTALVTQLVLGSLLLTQDVIRILIGAGRFAGQSLGVSEQTEIVLPSRRKFISLASAGIAAIPFFTMLYGISKGKYNYTIERVKLAFKDLPNSFDGFKVVQISDIHAGSLDSIEDVKRGVELVNDLSPDLILFTGDLVNSDKDEVNPYIDIFSKLNAKYGKYAVLGNHDYYGEYGMSEQEKIKYRSEFYGKFAEMGFKLLNNDDSTIEVGNNKISIVGVENWGAGRWFPEKGKS